MKVFNEPAINEAIAMRCGWRRAVTTPSDSRPVDYFPWIDKTGKHRTEEEVSRFCWSLDAMAYALTHLTFTEQCRMASEILESDDREMSPMPCGEELYWLVNASARVRAIAFCKVAGIWDEKTMVLSDL